MQTNIEVWVHIFAIALILVFTLIKSIMIILCRCSSIMIKLVAIVVLLCTIYIAANRNTYLPFLGYAAMPPSLFLDTSPHNASDSIVINVDAPDGTKIVYWAADKNNKIQKNPLVAYGDYSNSGITSVKAKKANICYKCPDNYKAGLFTLDKHIHYRIILPNSPIMSPVYTTFVRC